MRHKPLYARCACCPETRRPALVWWHGRWVCANCRHKQQGHTPPSRAERCAVCWRDGLPLQRHHPGRSLWTPRLTFLVCRSCHLVLSAAQRDRARWDVREPFHAVLDRLGGDHSAHELAQGIWEMARARAETRALFDLMWWPQTDDQDVLIPLGVPGVPSDPGERDAPTMEQKPCARD